jgi:hypothetical protein
MTSMTNMSSRENEYSEMVSVVIPTYIEMFHRNFRKNSLYEASCY